MDMHAYIYIHLYNSRNLMHIYTTYIIVVSHNGAAAIATVIADLQFIFFYVVIGESRMIVALHSRRSSLDHSTVHCDGLT